MLARGYPVGCNICGWHGEAFGGDVHPESAVCGGCGSIARDRFLYHCWTSRTQYDADARVLETSPRLGQDYRRQMARRVRYLCSDFDERAHKANLHLDLQAIDLPDASLDVILTSHVLEHVPDTARALAEIHRVLSADGVAYVMVPLPQDRTAPPTVPEYHDDNTLVHWRFGWDLADRMREAGFAVTTLVTEDLLRRARDDDPWGYVGPEVDTNLVLAGARRRLDDLTVVADAAACEWYGFAPSFFFVLWECRKGG